jgi:hypothetical protein
MASSKEYAYLSIPSPTNFSMKQLDSNARFGKKRIGFKDKTAEKVYCCSNILFKTK